jgi:hypothetical protein
MSSRADVGVQRIAILDFVIVDAEFEERALELGAGEYLGLRMACTSALGLSRLVRA